MPMAVKDINRFEKMNNLTINVYGCNEDGSEIYPRRISNRRDNKAINLLMLDNGTGYHYVLIRDLNRLLGSRAQGHTKIFCPYCCWGFDKRYLEPGEMVKHMDICFKFKGAKVEMPEKGKNKINFTN